MRDALNQLGTPGESRDERLTLKYRRCFRKQAAVLASAAWQQEEAPERRAASCVPAVAQALLWPLLQQPVLLW